MDIQKEILLAEQRIRTQIKTTSLITSEVLSRETQCAVHLKLENRQHTGSFKARGGLNKVMALSEDERKRGVITASTGNHGMGVARALQLTGVRGTIYLPRDAQPGKVEALRGYGAPVAFVDGSSLETELFAKARAAETGAVWISPYNDPQIIGGQGTIGIEILDALPHLDCVFITVGGGGLISGVGTYLKSRKASIQVIGCLPERSPEMYLSVQAGQIVTLPESLPTLSDGSAGGVEEGSITFPICQEIIDRFVLVTEEEIIDAIKSVYRESGERIEGSAGVAVAACRKTDVQIPGKNAVVLICGGNIDPATFDQIVE